MPTAAIESTPETTEDPRVALDMIPSRRWARAVRAVREGKVLVITGAGISAESGIPTFRGSDGYWTVGSERFTPQEMATSTMLENRADVLWDWYLSRLKNHMDSAKPNAGHHAVADLCLAMENERRSVEKWGLDWFLCVTQNIDDLHWRAGLPHLQCLQIHGKGHYMRCSNDCWLRASPGEGVVVRKAQKRPKFVEIPKDARFPEDLTCPDCGYLMRPHVLLFDEVYSQELYRSVEAHEFAQEADLVITVGCSGGVPIAQILANYAVVRDAVVIDVNPDDGPLANLARQQGAWLRGRAGIVLPKLVEFLTA
jgi:NAD-dependent deacetylase